MMEINNKVKYFTGVVEDCVDPLEFGRVRVRIHGLHTHIKSPASLTGIQTTDLIWSYVVQPITSASISGVGTTPTGIVNGTHVFGLHLDEFYQNNIVLGTTAGMYEQMPNFNYGFTDPKQEYPRYVGSDINTLARGLGGKSLEHKRETLLEGVEQCNSTWSEPTPVYQPTYPMNTVTETRSGHVTEYDDTPGQERITQWHKAGTFSDINPDGSKVTKVVNDNYEITLGNDFIAVKGSVNIFVEQNVDLHVKGNVDAHINGYMKSTVDGPVRVEGKQNVDAVVGDNLTAVVQNNTTLQVGNNLTAIVDNNATVTVKKDAVINVNGNCNETVGGDFTQHITGNYNLTVGGSKTDNISGGWDRNSAYVNDIASGTFSIDGSRINLG